MSERPTIRAIAAAAGVGVGTVSRVLNDDPRVAPATRSRVLAVIDATGYRRDHAARQLRSRRSATLGLITQDLKRAPFIRELMRGLNDASERSHRLILVIDADGREERVATALDELLQRQVEGIVLAAPFHRPTRATEALLSARRQVPVVLVDTFAHGSGLPALVPDEHVGARLAVDGMVRHGRRRIAFINVERPTRDLPASVSRWAGYRQALLERGLPYDVDLVRHGSGMADSGYARMRELLEQRHRPDAVFCGTDRIAMGAYAAIHEAGLTIPDDIAVVGFDDQRLISEALMPSLTSVALPHEAMGRRAVDLLVSPEDAAWRSPRVIRVPPSLVERTSS